MNGWRQKQAAARLVAGLDLCISDRLPDQVDVAEVVIRLAADLGHAIGSELVTYERARLLQELDPSPPRRRGASILNQRGGRRRTTPSLS